MIWINLTMSKIIEIDDNSFKSLYIYLFTFYWWFWRYNEYWGPYTNADLESYWPGSGSPSIFLSVSLFPIVTPEEDSGVTREK